MKGIEIASNTVKAFIDVFDGTLKVGLLFYNKFGSSNSVRRLILGMLSIK